MTDTPLRWEIIEGEALAVMKTLPDGVFDAVITDPPYSSGGAFRGDRMRDPTDKYLGDTEVVRPEFAGDNRDQRAYAYWSCLWMSEAMRLTKPGGVICVFSDWRQLPTTTDAIQGGGWIWRGIVPWDKTDRARRFVGRFGAQCEYVVWGTNGARAIDQVAMEIGPLPGFFQVAVDIHNDKHHVTGKPTALMRELVKITPAGGRVFDPFCGSGTTIVGALLEGRAGVGIERTAAYAKVARDRCAGVAEGRDWRAPTQGSIFDFGGGQS